MCLTRWGHTFVTSQLLPSLRSSSLFCPPLPSFPFFKRNTCSPWYSGLRAHVTSCASHGRAQTPCLQSSALRQWPPQPSQTSQINLRHFPLPQKQIPSGVLVIVYLYLFWPACRRPQTRALAQTTEILAKRISVSLTDRSSPDLTYSAISVT